VAVFDRLTTTGALTQRALTEGCVSDDGSDGCQNGAGLVGAFAVAVSPDGASVYAASLDSNSVTIFDRSTTNGELTQKPGTAGCIAETASVDCQDGKALAFAISVTVSPDGNSVYAASRDSDAVAIFDRNTTGTLTQKAGTAGCISETGTGGVCQDGAGLDDIRYVTASPDGNSAYAASASGGAVSIFDRNTTTGALTQKAGLAGCVSEDGSGGACVDGIGLGFAQSVTVSPDGTSVYSASQGSDAVAIFDRELAPAPPPPDPPPSDPPPSDPPPADPPPPSEPDELTFELKGKKKQKAKKLAVKAICSNPCEVSLRAKGKADGKFKSKRLVDEVAADEATKLRIRFKKKVRKQISGEKGKAKIVATATDADGQEATDKLPVKLKR